MDNGRVSKPDHDQKSVEFEKPLKGFRKRKTVDYAGHPIKQCSGCALWFPCVPECFDKDDTRSGFQSWCVECKDKWELKIDSRYRRMRAWLETKEPDAWAAWISCNGGAEAEFRRKISEQNDECFWCGAGLREWQSTGHNLDRKSNEDHTKHTPQNTVFACWPCNKTRGRKRLFAWKSEIEKIVKEHGWGCVPWSEIDDRFSRVKRRHCKHLSCEPPPQVDPRQLDLFGGAA